MSNTKPVIKSALGETSSDPLEIDPPTGFDKIHSKNPNTICLYPFTHINFKFQGAVGCCFRSNPLLNISQPDATTEDFWNGPEFRRLRKALAGGEKAEGCQSCWNQEKSSTFSYRQATLEDDSIHAPWREALNHYDEESGRMDTAPRQVEVRLSNLCNLSCRMCTPEYSSKWAGLLAQHTDFQNYHIPPSKSDPAHTQRILIFLKENNQTLRYVMFSGGEPLLQKGHYEALKALSPFESEITLEYTTNLSTLRKEQESVLHYWPRFKQVRVKISIDADPPIYPFVRVGGSIQAVEENIRTLQSRFPTQNKVEADSSFPDDPLIILATCTVSVYNVLRLPEIAKYFTRLGVIFHASQVQRPEFQNIQVLKPFMKAEIQDKIQNFLAHLDDELVDCWGDLGLWKNPAARQSQTERIRFFLENCVAFMMGADHSELFAKLLAFEETMGRTTRTPQLLEVYPHWAK